MNALVASVAFGSAVVYLAVRAAHGSVRHLRAATPVERGRVAATVGVVALSGALLALRHPASHQLYFDEDVYANMASNLLAGRGPAVTVGDVDGAPIVEGYKWPPGFPVFAAGFTAIAGPELGATTANLVLALVLLGAVAWLVERLSGSRGAALLAAGLVALQPTVGRWFRAGAAEPLFVTLTVIAFALCLPARDGARQRGEEARACAVLCAALAPLVRLEGALVLPVLAALLGRSGVRALWLSPTALTLVLLSAIGFLEHVTKLGDYYLRDRPESSFALGYVGQKLTENARWLLRGTDVVWLAGGASLGALAARFGPVVQRRWWCALGVLLGSHGLVIQGYSVGSYGAPGGSRLLLLPLTCSIVALACGAGVLLVARPALGRAAVLLEVAGAGLGSFPSSNALDEGIAAARLEHAAIVEWTQELPSSAIVTSRIPFLWSNLGVRARLPGSASPRGLGPHYVHRGLFDGVSDDPRDQACRRRALPNGRRASVCLVSDDRTVASAISKERP